MNKKIFVLLPALALMLGACGGRSNNNTSSNPSSSGSDTTTSEVETVEGVNINKQSATLDPGETLQLTAIATPSTLSDKSVVWSSDDTDVATVSTGGLVSAVAHGTARIRATANLDSTKYAECVVTVNEETIVVAAESPDLEQAYKLGCNQKTIGADSMLYFKGSVDSNTRGETATSWADGVDLHFEEVEGQTGKYYLSFMQGEAKKYFEMTDDHHYTVAEQPTAARAWSWNSEIKSVTRTIGTTTYFPGTYNNYDTISGCDITMVAQDYVFEFLYRVPVCEPESVTVTAAKDIVYAGGTLQLNAKLAPLGAKGDIVWSVSGDEEVTIDQNGLLTASANATLDGTVTVKAAYSETVYGEKVITVKEALNYGTQTNPLTVAEAKVLLGKENPSAETMYVEGIVGTSDAYATGYKNWGAIWLTNADGSVQKEFEAFRAVPAANTGFETTYAAKDSLVGKKVVFSGIGKIYGSTYELDAGCQLLSVTDGGRVATDVAITPAADCEIEQGATKAFSGQILPYGVAGTVTWTLTAIDHGNLDKASVSADGVVSILGDAVPGNQYLLRGHVGAVESQTGVVITVKEAGGGQQVDTIELTAQTLLGYSSSNIAYSTAYTDKAVEGVTFTYQQIGAYGSGMQWRNKLSDSSNGTKSNLYNKTAFGSAIVSLDLVWNAGKQVYANNNMLKITFDTVSTFDSANKEEIMFSTQADVKSYTITPTGTNFTYVKVEIDDAFTYTCYWENININVAA